MHAVLYLNPGSQFLTLATENVAAHGINGGALMLLGALRWLGPLHESSGTDLRRLFFVSLSGISKRLERTLT